MNKKLFHVTHKPFRKPNHYIVDEDFLNEFLSEFPEEWETVEDLIKEEKIIIEEIGKGSVDGYVELTMYN